MVVTQYQEPNRVARAANAAIRWLAELGVSVAGTCALRVRGRKSGKPRSVVINLLTADGVEYLVSPRGNTQWVRNVRAAGAVEVGPRWHRRPARAHEVDDVAKPDLLRRYLARWYWQVKGYVPGLTPDSSDEQLRAAAPSIPVFALTQGAGFRIGR
jgi:deazaflavin-dependent oxidoreductase (nitroreductase family)